ncbi:hypothetical protein KCM76_22895 [Zooshikella marina]|uniref:hypothetical protein n=1 Tax=Zooshikella ganghwensis TaxID=202772 RepID=UPI001BB09C10|nr:hypothetical protein [Zooshikella ganghwensis]MBU2708860.1 hypothetical protein [Zooshikella ganghwensis]
MRKLIATIAMTFIATTAIAGSNQSEIGNPKDVCFAEVCEITATTQSFPVEAHDNAVMMAGNYDISFALFTQPDQLLTSHDGVTIGKLKDEKALAYYTATNIKNARKSLEYAFSTPVSKAKTGDRSITAAFLEKSKLDSSSFRKGKNLSAFLYKNKSWTVAGGVAEISPGKNNAILLASHQEANDTILVIRLFHLPKKDIMRTISSLKRVNL